MTSPDHIARIRNVYAAVFLNAAMKEGQAVMAPRISLKSKYTAADGSTRYTHYLFPNEIPFALMALQKAFEWVSANGVGK